MLMNCTSHEKTFNQKLTHSQSLADNQNSALVDTGSLKYICTDSKRFITDSITLYLL